MDEATVNKLYGWKGRVHKAIKVFQQGKLEYVRVCALPRTKDDVVKSIRGTTCNHDADIALTWALLESSRKIVDATCDGYIASIRRSFSAYRLKKEKETFELSNPTANAGENNDNNNTPAITIWIEGIVENTINSHVKFIEQWRDIISDAQKEVAGWKGEQEKYVDMMCKIDEKEQQPTKGTIQQTPENELSDNGDGDSLVHNKGSCESNEDHKDSYKDGAKENSKENSDSDPGDDRLKLLRRGKGTEIDEHADRLFQLGSCVSAGKILISSLKIANKIESIETAAQEAGIACIIGLTQLNLRDRDVALNIGINQTNNGGHDEEIALNRTESTIVEEWKQQSDVTKLNAVYSWYRMYHGALSTVTMGRN